MSIYTREHINPELEEPLLVVKLNFEAHGGKQEDKTIKIPVPVKYINSEKFKRFFITLNTLSKAGPCKEDTGDGFNHIKGYKYIDNRYYRAYDEYAYMDDDVDIEENLEIGKITYPLDYSESGYNTYYHISSVYFLYQSTKYTKIPITFYYMEKLEKDLCKDIENAIFRYNSIKKEKYSCPWRDNASIKTIMLPEWTPSNTNKYPLCFRQLIFTLLFIFKNKIHKPLIFYIIKILLSKINFMF